MKKHKLPAALSVTLIAGGMLAISSLFVPEFVNSAVVAKDQTAAQNKAVQNPAEQMSPVLKVEAPAPVSTVNDDLFKDMTEEQIQQIYAAMDKPGNDPRISGRELTDSEINRRRVLEDKYVYEGLRPKQILPLEPGHAELYVDLETNTYTYPERTLTDEELLQLIDWSYRLNYAASKRNVTTPAIPHDISKEDAANAAAKSVRKLFDGDVSKLKATVTLGEPGLKKRPTWMVHYAPHKSLTLLGKGESYWEYHVLIDAKSGAVIDTTAFNPTLKRTPIDAAAPKAVQKDKRWIQKATQIVKERQGESRPIVKAYLTDQETNNKRGMVAVKLMLKDGSSYTAELRYPDQTLRCLIYEAADKK